MKQQSAETLTITGALGDQARGKILVTDHPQRSLIERLIGLANYPPVEILVAGQRVYTAPDSAGRLLLRDGATLMKLARHPEFQLGELYSNGDLEFEGDIVSLLTAIFQKLPDFSQRPLWIRLLGKLYLLRNNTISRAAHNIHHHYDIGNEFYRLWLDTEAMQYTCAYFPGHDATLEQAQLAKLDHVCRKLDLQPGQTVAEAGCGWGGLARHMAKHYGVKVKAYNISREQVAFAREKAAAEGLADRVEYVLDDYRNLQGEFDAFVSVGMLEHVGVKNYPALGQVIRGCLKPEGRALVHSIGRNRPAPMNIWTEKHIFPGAYPPSIGQFCRIFEPNALSVLDVENIRLHYALTLKHWLARFEDNLERVRAMFDERFVRMWRFYLASSAAAFACGELQLFQFVVSHCQNNDVPMTRNFLYRKD